MSDDNEIQLTTNDKYSINPLFLTNNFLFDNIIINQNNLLIPIYLKNYEVYKKLKYETYNIYQMIHKYSFFYKELLIENTKKEYFKIIEIIKENTKPEINNLISMNSVLGKILIEYILFSIKENLELSNYKSLFIWLFYILISIFNIDIKKKYFEILIIKLLFIRTKIIKNTNIDILKFDLSIFIITKILLKYIE